MGLLETLGLPHPKRLQAVPELPAGAATAAPRAAAPTATGGLDAIRTGLAGLGDKLGEKAFTPQDVIDATLARNQVVALLAALNAHAEKATVQAQITQATTKLAQADAKLKAGDPAGAKALLDSARTDCENTLVLANKLSDYRKKRAVVEEQVLALRRLVEPAVLGVIVTAVQAADAKLPNFAAAAVDLVNVANLIAAQLKKPVDEAKNRLAALDAMDAKVKAFLAADLAKARPLVAQADAALTAKEWGRCLMAAIAAGEVLAPAQRLADRRKAFETQRALLATAIGSLKGNAVVKDRAAEFDAALTQADTLASRTGLQFEAAIALIGPALARCNEWLGTAPAITGYRAQRPGADSDLAALKSGPSAKSLAGKIAAIEKALDAATKLSAQAAAPGGQPAADWGAALAQLQRARADLDEAKSADTASAPAIAARDAAAQAASAKPADLAGLDKALKALQAEATAAQAAPFAALATERFAQFKKLATSAQAALTKKDAKAAAAPIAAAAEALIAARQIQAAHAQFAPALAALEARATTLAALKTAASIKPRIDAVTKAIAEARAFDKAHAAIDAMATLRRGEEAATAAEQADRDRRAFDTQSAALAPRIAALADAKAKVELGGLAAAAKAQADALKFDAAGKALKDIDLRLDTIKVKGMLGGSPPDPALAATASALADKGGGKTLDAMLAAMPDTADVRTVAALAKGRFGVDFTPDGGAPSAQEVKTLKAVCKTLAKVPQDVRGRNSLQGGISHLDATGPGSVGGGYNANTASISLKGRPKTDDQEFGSKLKVKLADGSKVNQLPAAIDADSRPKDEKPVDVLDWATMHEVGHGIDDANTYMANHGHQPDMGGWRSYGGNVQPIADAVGAHFNFYSTPEEKKYVLDKIMNKKPVDPPPQPGDWANRKRAFDDWHKTATAENVYRNQALCDNPLTIGPDRLIYQEAYGNNWVSYRAEARKKGLTGYQFRAPGEWFAELYAGYKTGKLGDKHPALSWLRKLSP